MMPSLYLLLAKIMHLYFTEKTIPQCIVMDSVKHKSKMANNARKMLIVINQIKMDYCATILEKCE